ncbi:uncharacterized protein B0H18DRAFT_1082009 [Fomitopsis serialis]|uniref:uncharacterized protein n=1 Tax=Fomitopsis serialis TaxID=139415 RepID=UPI00200876D7|nr:uncharacterized protein B0H18DRAFT_1082009 [Neoantrodia serialis]KAH9936398.1 hypothetical protein B0H18DRAFT_1082009 [Neoantrodia serialis]
MTRTPRTLVMCFDGTANEYNGKNTNVVKLYSLLNQEHAGQLCYYQPGIGTYLNPGVVSPVFSWAAKVLDQGVAWYLDAHVRDGYRFLMQNYRPGDKISLFGFSRGAYTARALAGMIHKIGLLPRDNPEQIPFAYNLYKRTDAESITIAAGFKKTFCREVQIEFVGVWDTVASVGSLVSKTLPFVANNTTIKTFRHALALDEHRAKFRPNLYHRPSPLDQCTDKSALKQNVMTPVKKGVFPPPSPSKIAALSEKMRQSLGKRSSKHHSKHHSESAGLEWANLPSAAAAEFGWEEKPAHGTDVLEVWFAGCHCDIGGSAVPDTEKLSLADITLRWMVKQIVRAQCGIVFDTDALHDANIPDSIFTGPDFPPLHDELKRMPLWWILELLPTNYNWQEPNGRWHNAWSIHLGRARHLPPDPNLHITVKERMNDKALRYVPRATWRRGSETFVD